tara:strand:- start:10301 stop:11194 length:894 start_codon:yes stop_codon:yes gene_type:complete
MISISGVAFLLEDDLDRMFVPGNVRPSETEPLRNEALEARIAEVYSDFDVFLISPSSNPERAVLVVLRSDGTTVNRYFDQYRGVDRGSSLPWQAGIYRWLIDFHDDLFITQGGREINGWGAAVFLLMMLSGLFIWWRGKAQWQQGLYITPKSPRATLWQLHSVFGFWCLFFMLAWGISGMFLTIPGSLRAFTDTFGLSNALGMGLVGLPDAEIESILAAGNFDGSNMLINRGDIRADRSSGFMDLLVDIHFGRFESRWAGWALAFIGLIPAMMFITGFILWWQRVVMRSYRKIMKSI